MDTIDCREFWIEHHDVHLEEQREESYGVREEEEEFIISFR